MIALYTAAFVAGLVLLVRSMLTGVEKPGGSSAVVPPHHSGTAANVSHHDGSAAAASMPHERRSAIAPSYYNRTPAVRIRTLTLGAFGVAFGTVGVFLERSGAAESQALHLLFATIAGGLAAVLAVLMLVRWARPALAEAVEDPRYVLQGIPATVTRAVSLGSAGEISYRVDESAELCPALGLDGGEHAVGDEVIIDRIEEGVAFVESWALVEQRL